MRTHLIIVVALFLFACGRLPLDAESGGTAGGEGSGAGGGSTDGWTQWACEGDRPLQHGDVSWSAPPFPPPGARPPGEDSGTGGASTGAGTGTSSGSSTGTSGGSGGESGWGDGGFVNPPDGGAGEACDVFAQDCLDGQKCTAAEIDGGVRNVCVPVDPDPAAPGETCMRDAGTGADDCATGAICLPSSDPVCVDLCGGSSAMPTCGPGEICVLADGGATPLCLPADCGSNGVCGCACPTADPDCGPDECSGTGGETEGTTDSTGTDGDESRRAPEGDRCPDSREPVTLYMSNDDSNSQASPILARRRIREGQVVMPEHVRIHEFVNYHAFDTGGPRDRGARIELGMRRISDDGAFALVVAVQGRVVTEEERPPFNLVFSLDTSGSMSGEPLELSKASIRALAGNLRGGDVISLVTWSDRREILLDGLAVGGADDPELIAALDLLEAGGSTDLHAGLVTAYELANRHRIDEGINRVVLVSDGGANTGVTDTSLIASEAEDADGEGIYLVGVGISEASEYRDDLMDAVTDAGKGAYVFIDGPEEAERTFGERFLPTVAVAARDVRTHVTLPWHFGIEAFHGEDYSPNPARIDPQHLAPNDAMVFHQIVASCAPDEVRECDEIRAGVEYLDPLTGEVRSEEVAGPIAGLVVADDRLLYQADVVVAYAKALITIGQRWRAGLHEDAITIARDTAHWTLNAAYSLGDPELAEIGALLEEYADRLAGVR